MWCEDNKEEKNNPEEEPEWEGTECPYIGRALLNFCLVLVSLVLISNQLESVGVEKV